MKQNPVNIPQDIHELILDYFILPPPTAWHDCDTLQSAENRAMLLAYSMVSRSFCVAAYSRLFSSAILRLKVSSPAFNKRLFTSAIQVIQRFVVLLQDSFNFPNLGMIYHIRSFCLTISGARDSNYSYKFLRDATVYRIIDILHGPNHSIESLSFNASIGHFTLEYSKMDDQLICAFENILRSPKLKHVRLCGLFGIPRSLFHGVHFKHLELYETRLARGEIKVDPPHIAILESIGLDESFSLVDLLHSGNRSANIASRYQSAFVELHTLYFQAELTWGIHNIINISCNAVNTLHILNIQLIGHDWLQSSVPSGSYSSPPAIYPFHLLIRLSSLRISSKDTGIYLHDIIDPFCRVLQSCSFPQSLRKLNVEMTASHDWNSSYHTMNRPNEWPEMDSVLVQPMFNAVPQVNITLEYFVKLGGYPFGDAIGNFNKRFLSTALPKFSKSRQNTSSSFNVIITKPRVRSSNTTELTFKCGGRKVLDIPS